MEATVNDTCAKLDAAIDAGTAPHIIIDATTTGLISETVKSITRALALPTFSASYGQEGDIRQGFCVSGLVVIVGGGGEDVSVLVLFYGLDGVTTVAGVFITVIVRYLPLLLLLLLLLLVILL